MDITINLEDFKNWADIFKEIDRQSNLRLFRVIEPDPATVHCKEIEQKPKQFSSMQQEGVKHYRQGRRASEREAIDHKRKEVVPRARLTSTPRSTIKISPDEVLQRDSRLTDAAKTLSKEQMALLYEDIFKPLDVFSILIERRKQMNNRKI